MHTQNRIFWARIVLVIPVLLCLSFGATIKSNKTQRVVTSSTNNTQAFLPEEKKPTNLVLVDINNMDIIHRLDFMDRT